MGKACASVLNTYWSRGSSSGRSSNSRNRYLSDSAVQKDSILSRREGGTCSGKKQVSKHKLWETVTSLEDLRLASLENNIVKAKKQTP